MEDILFKTENLIFNESIKYKEIFIKKNRTSFVTGASGSGKSSLLRMLNKTVNPSSGKIFYYNTNLNQIDSILIRENVLLVSQSIYLFDKSIRENFYEFYTYRNQDMLSDEEIMYFLNICEIDFSLDTICSNLSGGEKQRIYIAIYLSFSKEVLMLDEPTSALDQINSDKIMANIINYCKKRQITLIVVSHDQYIIGKYADLIIDM